MLSGQRDLLSQRDLLLLDVTPLTLGIETTGGVMDVLIQRNTVVPAQATKLYTNAEDNQARTPHALPAPPATRALTTLPPAMPPATPPTTPPATPRPTFDAGGGDE